MDPWRERRNRGLPLGHLEVLLNALTWKNIYVHTYGEYPYKICLDLIRSLDFSEVATYAYAFLVRPCSSCARQSKETWDLPTAYRAIIHFQLENKYIDGCRFWIL